MVIPTVAEFAGWAAFSDFEDFPDFGSSILKRLADISREGVWESRQRSLLIQIRPGGETPFSVIQLGSGTHKRDASVRSARVTIRSNHW